MILFVVASLTTLLLNWLQGYKKYFSCFLEIGLHPHETGYTSPILSAVTEYTGQFAVLCSVT